MSAYIIKDKKDGFIKIDKNKMLCIFDYERDAERYLKTISRADADLCEIVKRDLTFARIE